MNGPYRKVDSSTVATRGLLFTGVWWLLTDAEASAWWIGAPAVLLALFASIVLLPPVPLVWRQLFGFVPFFLWHSLRGGVDVAWRALHPRLPIAPDLIDYPLRLPTGLPQVIMANTVSLLPGTLSAELDQQVLKVHVLAGQQAVLTELKRLELAVAKLCGASLAPAANPSGESVSNATENRLESRRLD